ncbi:MAG: hypothetical protein FD167_4396, partial [bacterium]
MTKNYKSNKTRDNKIRSTTVISVRQGNNIVMAADGQVTLGNTI